MNTNITAFILAGGESRRFGENKALFQYKKKPLIAHVIDKISGSFKNLVIIGKNDAIYRKFGYTVIEDLLPYQNPLVGIYTGLMYSNTDWNFFIACDMPFFNA
ncbi:MAG: molybdenum cofactor guanylyltransferase, partial [Candidatus Paceibacterota bacterium]